MPALASLITASIAESTATAKRPTPTGSAVVTSDPRRPGRAVVPAAGGAPSAITRLLRSGRCRRIPRCCRRPPGTDHRLPGEPVALVEAVSRREARVGPEPETPAAGPRREVDREIVERARDAAAALLAVEIDLVEFEGLRRLPRDRQRADDPPLRLADPERAAAGLKMARRGVQFGKFSGHEGATLVLAEHARDQARDGGAVGVAARSDARHETAFPLRAEGVTGPVGACNNDPEVALRGGRRHREGQFEGALLVRVAVAQRGRQHVVAGLQALEGVGDEHLELLVPTAARHVEHREARL